MPFYRLRKSGGLLLQTVGGGGGEEPEFTVNWNSGTGTGSTAVMDENGDHPFVIEACPEFPQLMRVVAGSDHGWVATPNVLEIRCQGDICRQIEQEITSLATETDWYHRVFFMMPPGPAHSDPINHPNVHGFSSGLATWMGFSQIGASVYRIHIQYADFISGDFRWFREYCSPELDKGTWYRLETHIEVFGVHPYDSGLRAWRIHPRIYSVTNAGTGDLSGSLLYDEGDYVHRDIIPGNTLALLHSPTGADGWPLDTVHDGDEYWGPYHPTLHDHIAELRSIGVGNEGPGGHGAHTLTTLMVLAAMRAQQDETGGGVWVGTDIWNPEG